MSTTYLELEEFGKVKLFRRRGLKNIRISINAAGEVRLSIPWYVPKAAGIKYLKSKKDWIQQHHKPLKSDWINGQLLTKNCILNIGSHEFKNTKVTLTEGLLSICLYEKYSEAKKQQLINFHINKFYRAEAEKLLKPLTEQIAKKYGYRYKSIKIKRLKSRWGSCNHQKVITFNSSMLNLPQDLIEYIIVHELVHTKHLNHSKSFWQELETRIPDYRKHRKILKSYNSAGIS